MAYTGVEREFDDIVMRISRSDRAAFDELYRRLYPLLVNYAGLMVSREAARDIVQDVFFKLWQGRKGLLPESSGGGNIRSFLLRTTYNAAISAIRHNLLVLNYYDNAVRELESYYSAYDVDRSEMLRILYSRDIRSVIDRAISKLPPRCREVFLLSYVENLSNQEISERLGLSLSTVENHIHNALVRLRTSLLNESNSL